MRIPGASTGEGHEASLPPVPLNHCFRVLDSATYRAIEESEFLRTEFAPFEMRTTVRTDRTYSGIYLYGAHTYFEFFDVARAGMGGLGHSGLAFGVDEPGALQQLQARLAPEFPVEQTTITRQLGDRQIPWFLHMAPTGIPAGAAVSLWLMEYHPRFLTEWHPQAGGEEGLRRDQILQRYAATLKDVPSHPCLQDVVGLTLAADPATRRFLTQLCGRMGYQTRADGDVTLLDGPDIVLRLVPESASARGIQEMVLRVQRAPAGGTSLRFGPQSMLSFRDDSTAVWSF